MSFSKNEVEQLIKEITLEAEKQIDMAYDVQTKITSEEDVGNFHTYYLNVLKQVLDDPSIKVADIKLSL